MGAFTGASNAQDFAENIVEERHALNCAVIHIEPSSPGSIDDFFPQPGLERSIQAQIVNGPSQSIGRRLVAGSHERENLFVFPQLILSLLSLFLIET